MTPRIGSSRLPARRREVDAPTPARPRRGSGVDVLVTATLGVGAYTSLLHALTSTTAAVAALTASLHTLLTLSLAMITWRHVGAGRSRERRLAATITVAWHGACATVLTAVGPWHWPYTMIWVAGGLTVGGYWVIRDWTRGLAGDTDRAGGTLGEISELTAVARSRTAGARVDEHGTLSTDLALPPGYSARRELATSSTAEALASMTDLPVTAVRITPDADSARRARLEIATIDHLAEPRSWPGASQPGASIAEPLRAGVYGDGRDAVVNLTGCPDGSAEHLLVTGISGAGKTDGVVGLVADGLTRRQVCWLVLDTRKAIQSYGHLAPYLWLESDAKRVRLLLRRLAQVITARTTYLGEHGYKDWRPGCGLTYLIVVLEEAYDLVDDGRYDQVAFAARSAGISLISSIQRPTYDTMSTSWRSQHAAFWCFGTRTADDATYGLPDALAGLVHPEAWGKNKPGYSYLGGHGVTDDDVTRPLRSYRLDHLRDQLAAYVSAWRRHLGLGVEVDPVTAEAFGEVWASRTHYPDPHAADATPATPTLPTPTPGQETTAGDTDTTDGPGREVVFDAATPTPGDDPDQEQVSVDVEAHQADLVEQLRTAADADLTEIPPQHRHHVHAAAADPAWAGLRLPADTEATLAALDPADGQVARSHGRLRSAWLAWLAGRYRAGDRVLDRPTAVAWASSHDRSDAWVDKQLVLLVDAGTAHRHPTQRGVVILDTEPVDPLALLTTGGNAA